MKRAKVYTVDEGHVIHRPASVRHNLGSEFSEIQYRTPATRIPWRALLLAGILFFFGVVLMVAAAFMIFNVTDVSHTDRIWAIFALGVILFVPGAYHVFIAYHAFKGDQGFSFDDIPDFD